MAEVSNSKLLQINTGIPKKDACVVIVRTEWNAGIIDELEKGCVRILEQHGISHIRIVNVPGAFEIPFGIKNFWDINKYRDDRPDAFIALGCVLRGDTPHFDYVCQGVTQGVLQLNLSLPVPTIFGVLTVDNQQQADERIGGKHGHKGEEAAITAIKMIALANSYKK
ncbi:6,7-dimethyl-8-ribityllumazine synthase [Pseudoflavitalea sp. X16]|jgi:6,7-dimethyl-8-ribityllumazine synthase|uniref:6,7-dimethyl-8-ribityllumazine synthase n=1 Tax=Paraflavitalea devenefica TaxID=2716334 RepID=UPI00141EAD06|nr:6,7-dimethyl-8-ribityllumazine synthase [Paraflavitalea devenefica]NII28941.1 6,7-dimethyl-8-ribityllumazine synthase [Paraflavitalea devenefica]